MEMESTKHDKQQNTSNSVCQITLTADNLSFIKKFSVFHGTQNLTNS